MTLTALREWFTIGCCLAMMVAACVLAGAWLFGHGDRVDLATALALWANAGVLVNYEVLRP